MTMSGALPSDFEVVAGSTVEKLNGDGSFDLSLAAGATNASFQLVEIANPDVTSDIANGANVQLFASMPDPTELGSQALTSSAISVTCAPVEQTTSAAPKNLTIITGQAGTGSVGSSTPSTTGFYHGDGHNDQAVGTFQDNDIDLSNSVNDSLVGGTGKNTLIGGTGNDIFTLHGTNDLVALGSGNSTVNGSTNSTGQATIYGYGGNAVINAHNASDVILMGSGKSEIYADSQASLGDAITQLALASASGRQGDLISSLNGDATIVGSLGNDLITAGTGKAVVVMGPGQDTFFGGWDITDLSGDHWGTVNKSDGTIEVDGVVAQAEPYSNPYAQPYNGNFTIENGVPVPDSRSDDTVFGGTGNDIISLGNGSEYAEAGSGNTIIDGGMGDDTIIGGSGTDTLRGGGGNTYIEAGSGNQLIWGGDGNNTIIGGAGNSTIKSAAASLAIETNGRWAGDTSTTNYVFAGSGNSVIVGSAGSDTLVAGSGNSTLQGGLGHEYLVGGSGLDVLLGGDGFDTLVAGTGNNTLQAGSGTSATSWLYGGDGTDLIQGGGGQNYLWAGDGGTVGAATTVMGSLSVASSSTTIYGGLGVDFLQGGAGSTVIDVGDGGSAAAPTSVVATSGNTTINGGNGVDFIQGGTAASVLNAGDGGDFDGATTVLGMSGIATLTGGAGTDVLWDGTAGQDLIIGGTGTDTLAGIGADTLVAGSGDQLLENLGGDVTIVLGASFGSDLVQINAGSHDELDFSGGITATDLTGSVEWDAGNNPLLVISSVDGDAIVQGALSGSLSNVSFGSQGSYSPAALMTTMFHQDQSFVLNPGRSEDVVVGTNEAVTVGANWYGDTVSAWGANETIKGGTWSGQAVYSAGASATIIGNSLMGSIVAAGANAVVTGYCAAVTLSGSNSIVTNSAASGSLTASGAGDTLIGGSGNYNNITNFYVNDSSTTVVSNNTSGHDAVTSTVNFALPTNANALILAGSANIVGTANAGTDTLYGSAGVDTLVSGTGVDVLVGGSNATAYVVNNSADTVDTSGYSDTVYSSVNFALPYGTNILVLTGNAALSGTANDRVDTLVSNSGIDTLVGGGNDLFIVNNAADVVTEASWGASDTLQSAFDATLSTNVNTLVLTGTAALTGHANDGNDTLVSNAGIDTLVGGAGSDTFVINNVADVVQGANASSAIVAGVNVTLPGSVATLTLAGNAALSATGNASADSIVANSGNDTLTAVSTAAATTLVGGSGNDLFVINNASDVIQVASTTAQDTLQSSVSVTAPTNVNVVVLTGSANLQATANGAGDTLVSNSGIDTLVGGAGNDVFVVNNVNDVLLNVSATDTIIASTSLTVPAGSNIFDATGGLGITVTTNSGNDLVTGNAGNDTMVATTGQDTLVAGLGVDTLVAGSGNDLFVVNNASDVVSLAGAHGDDTIQSSLSWTLPSGINTLALTGSGNLTGRAVSGNNLVVGNAGNDTLIAGSGSDTLQAGTGLATLVGGTGADTFVIDNAADTITGISASFGNAVYSSVDYTMQANVSTLVLTGSGDLVGIGNGSSDVIVGNAGADTLIAGSGAADLRGGTGSDLFIVNSTSDTVSETDSSNGHQDTIQSSVSFTLPQGVDELVLTGTGNLVATGNAENDSIVGNAGNDTLQAGAGNDTLVSGSGVTVLLGGAGNDTFVVNNAGDVISNISTNENVLISSVSITLPTNINTLRLTGAANLVGTANGADDLLQGNAGADQLVALGGNDTLVAGSGLATLVGGTGNDTFVVDNSADSVMAGSANNVMFSSASFVLPAHIDALTLTGAANISGTGNADADTLTAGGGNDTLIAGSGVAVMNGGSWATTFVVNNTADVVQNASAGAPNALQSSVSYTLPANVNLLTLTGSAALTGTGNAGDDTLVGNTGIDTLVSGSGNDLFIVGNASTKLTNASTSNSDTVQSAFNFVLPTNIDTLVLTGSAALTGQANAGNDTLVSNSGVDTFTAGAGNDVFVINNTADVVQGALATSTNAIVASVNVTLPTNVNILMLTGSDALQATGNSGADSIVANSGDDTLTAVSTAAVTTLVGGAGNDVFIVNNTADVVQATTTGADTIESSANFTANANVNTLVLTGSANLQATANAAGDTLVSNAGIDTLTGGAGADVFVVNNSADVLLNVGAGDTIESSVNYALTTPNATLVLTDSADLAASASGSGDTLVANSGADTLTAASGSETLVGGAGNDVFVVSSTSDVIVQLNYPNASTVTSAVSYALPELVDNLVLTGSANLTGTGNSDMTNVLLANSGNDVLRSDAVSATVIGGTGADTIWGGAGADVIYAGTGGNTIYAGNGLDTIYGNTNAVISDTLGGSDLLVAGAGAETLTGFGADTLESGSGNALLEGDGLRGPIQYVINPGFGQVSLGAAYRYNIENIDFAAGISESNLTVGVTLADDVNSPTLLLTSGTGTAQVAQAFQPGDIGTITFAGANPESFAQFMNASGLGTVTVHGASSDDIVSTGDGQAIPRSDSLVADVYAFGNGDSVTGTNEDVYAYGNAATITGGNTWAEGNADQINANGSWVWVAGANDTIVASASGGTFSLTTPQAATTVIQAAAGLSGVQIQSDVSYALPSNVQSLTLNLGYDSLTASSNAQGGSLIANGNFDTLTGGAGTDQLVAMGHGDVLVGGSGAESYTLEFADDSIQAGSGDLSLDTVTASFSFALGDTANTLVMAGDHAVGTANAGNDSLLAYGEGDTLVGGAGNDTLSSMYYEAVTMVGGSGNTTFIVHYVDTVVDASTTTSNTLIANGSGSFVLPANVNTMVLTASGSSGTGNGADDVISVGSYAGSSNTDSDTLVAGTGNDTLAAGSTSGDTFVFNTGFGHDVITGSSTGGTIVFGPGITKSSLTFSAVPGTGGAPSSLVIAGAGGAVTVQGGAVPGVINTVSFSDGTSDSLAQLLVPSGRSSAAGSSGNLILSSLDDDSIVGGSGRDTIYAWGNGDTLTAGVGGASINAAGTGDLVTGGAGTDRLEASGTNSTLVGGAGHETFVVDDPSIMVTGGNTTDTVVASVSYKVPVGVTAMSLVGSSDSYLSATANNLNDVITGGAGNNAFNDGTGQDTFIAGPGSNTFYVHNANDVIQAAGNGAQNSISSTVSYTLPESVDQLAINGDSLVAIGNDQNDTLSASGMFDTLVSGSGVDVASMGEVCYFEINNSADSVISVAPGYTANLLSSVNYVYTGAYNAELQLTGSANLTAVDQSTGNAIHITGNAGNDTLVGRTGSTLTAGTGVDTLEAAGGSNGGIAFYVNNSADVVLATGSNNTVWSTVNYTLPASVTSLVMSGQGVVGTGNASDGTRLTAVGGDTLVGGSGSENLISDTTTSTTSNFNTLVAGTGHDVFNASGGDTLVFNPGFGNSQVMYVSSAMTRALNVDFGAGVAPAQLTATAITDSEGLAALQISDGTGSVTLDGALAGSSGLTYQFAFPTGGTVTLGRFLGEVDVVDSTLAGGSGNIVFKGGANTAVAGGSGNDTLMAAGVGDTLTGGTGTQVLEALGTNDSIVGGSSADTLMALGTNDTLAGGSAADLFVAGANSSAVFVVNNSSDTFQVLAGAGADTIASSSSYTLPTGINTLVLTGSAALSGKANNGADTLISNTGVDTLTGGTGADLFVLNNAADVVSVGSSHGIDTIQAAFNDTLAANVAVLVLAGGAPLMGTGNTIADTLRANDAGDTLVAGTGAATMIGGAGSDLFVVDNAADSVQSAGGAGVDTVSSSVSFTLPGNVNTLVMTGAGSIKGAANTGNDLLTASASTGKVTLVGGSGADTLVSGTGVDSLVGGTGNALFIINNASDVVSVASTTVADTIQSAFNDTLAANVSTLVLTGSGSIVGAGNAIADTIFGNAGADTLSAGTGLATLVAGTGNDLFVVNNTNDKIVDTSSTAVDTISSSASFTLPSQINTLVLTGSGAITGTGNANNDLLTAGTSTGAVTLAAGNGADTLVAGSGADVLVSGTGVDSLVGGTGNDLFVLSNAADVVSVGATHGIDTIQASFNDTLAANVANLVLTGSGALMGTGNTLADTITANSGNDTLVAGSGAAKLIGGTGNDLFVVNATTDVVSVASTTTADTIQSSVSYTLATNVQTLKLTGATALTGTGGATTAGIVVGNTGADTLNGGAAIAVLEAGTAGAQVLKATGNQAVLVGGGAADTLTGGAYKDFYAAGKVGDTITVGAKANVIAVNKGDGATIIAPVAGSANVLSLGAGIDTEALTFTKSGNNLLLNDGVAGDSITFTNWFSSTANQTTTTLQVIEAASASYNSTGTDALRNKPIEEFSFTNLVKDYGTAGNPANWQLSTKEGADTIASSATAAYGGDLAYYDGKNGNLTGMNLSATQSTLTNASYATALQTIDSWASISGGASPMAVVAGGASSSATQTSASSTTDGHETTQPVLGSGSKQAAYVSALQLAAVMRQELGSSNAGALAIAATAGRSSFNDLWAVMHRQLDASPGRSMVGSGVEMHSFDLSPDVVAMLSGAATGHSSPPDRKVALPTSGLHQA